jgi:hypothetical protein
MGNTPIAIGSNMKKLVITGNRFDGTGLTYGIANGGSVDSGFIGSNSFGSGITTPVSMGYAAAGVQIDQSIPGDIRYVKIQAGYINTVRYTAGTDAPSGACNPGDISYALVPSSGYPKGHICNAAAAWVSMGNL